jgi:succinyl-diaminopimelate desuccinylase
VTEGSAADWEYPPFGGTIVDRRLYGRGSADMKGGLAAAIGAAGAIARSGVSIGGDLVVAALVDEETGMRGVKHFARSDVARRITAAVICEPEDNRICVAQKGVMWVRVHVRGKMAHGCMPRTGINPIGHLARFLVELQNLETQEIARLGPHPFLGDFSLTPTAVRAPVEGAGEEQENVIPATARATLDVRLIPPQRAEEVEAAMRGIVARLRASDPGFDAELELVEVRAATATPLDDPLLLVMQEAYRDLTGEEATLGGVPGTTDGTILHQWCGTPIVTCGPGCTTIPHRVDEFLDLDQLAVATRLYALTALRYLG